MGLESIRRRESIDLAERAAFLRNELLPEFDAEIDAAEGAEDPEYLPEELRETRKRLAKQADDCERVVDALGGDGEFVIRELMADETGLLQDDVTEQMVDADPRRETMDFTPKEGYRRNRTLQLAIVEWPSEMNTMRDRELSREVVDLSYMPDLIADYLFECVTELNDAGSVDEVGNSLDSYVIASSDAN